MLVTSFYSYSRMHVIRLKLFRLEFYSSAVSPEWHPGPMKSHSLMFKTDTEAPNCTIVGYGPQRADAADKWGMEESGIG